jgi:hypothetical protein
MDAKTPASRKEVQERRKEHIQHIRRERAQYYATRAKSTKDSTILSIIIDGMDQSKTDPPEFKQSAKSDDKLTKLKCHVTGVLIHGRERKAFAFVVDETIPSDTNLNLLCLIKAFDHLGWDQLPDDLYIQMDNTGKDNKNYDILAFLTLLVKCQKLKNVYWNFLPVGHTHEDIDQMFSCFSRCLMGRSFGGIDEIMKIIEEAYTPKPFVIKITECPGVVGWLKPLSYKFRNGQTKLVGISNAHAFWIHKAANGDVEASYKIWRAEDKWLPTQPFTLMEADEKVPEGTPWLVAPRLVEVDALITSMESVKQRLQPDDYAKSLDHLNTIKDRQAAMCPVCRVIRETEGENARNHKDSKHTAAEKAGKRKEAQQELREHQATEACNTRKTVPVNEWPLVEQNQLMAPAPAVEPEPVVPDDLDGEGQNFETLWEAKTDATPAMYQGPQPKQTKTTAAVVGDIIITEQESPVYFWVGKIIEIVQSSPTYKVCFQLCLYVLLPFVSYNFCYSWDVRNGIFQNLVLSKKPFLRSQE